MDVKGMGGLVVLAIVQHLRRALLYQVCQVMDASLPQDRVHRLFLEQCDNPVDPTGHRILAIRADRDEFRRHNENK